MQGFHDLFDPKSLMVTLDILLKMGLAIVLAGVIGWEREKHGRPAGIRTHMLLILGVVLFTEASKTFIGNPDRIASNIVTGVGFLGAGTIMRAGLSIKGLTSAASIWATAGIGMAISVGGPFILVALVGTALTLFTLDVVDNFERKLKLSAQPHSLQVSLANESALVPLFRALETAQCSLESFNVVEAETGVQLTVDVIGTPELIMQAVVAVPGVKAATWTP